MKPIAANAAVACQFSGVAGEPSTTSWAQSRASRSDHGGETLLGGRNGRGAEHLLARRAGVDRHNDDAR